MVEWVSYWQSGRLGRNVVPVFRFYLVSWDDIGKSEDERDMP